jgi:pimeloyl-ACP methyl ester carboxylesterase
VTSRSIRLEETPLAPGLSPLEIHVRKVGSGPPLVFLHGGWGYEIYPFDRQLDAFGDYRVIIPDRTGYGRSPRIADLPADFHRRAAAETSRVLDALGIERAALWGHSDGAVIAVWMALAEPDRFTAVILEAVHFFRVKPRSREFFETAVRDPDSLGERVCRVLERDHGSEWRTIIRLGGQAWLALADTAPGPEADLYDGRLGDLAAPVLFVHGADDPRTEPEELEAARRALPRATFAVIPGAGHSPHSERGAFEECNRAVREFLDGRHAEDGP